MYKGTSASAGIGIGTAVIVEEAELVIERREIADADAEIQRFKGALERTIADTERMAQDLAARVGEKEAEIMQGHMMLLSDPMLTGEIENAVRNEKVNSEIAIENVCNMYADMFASMGDELMQQRATDMRDIKTRMQKTLMGIQSVDIAALAPGSVLVAKDLTPSMTAGINPANVVGIVTELGGRTSHSAILARALEIPAVVAVTGFLSGVRDGDEVVLDGSSGDVYVNPDEETKKLFTGRQSRFMEEKKELEKYIGRPSVTKDGVRVEIVANIGKPEDVEKVLQYDGEGIGLFRTEFLFMDREAMPTEDEQFEAYKKVAEAMDGKPVIIRTLDIGGDKEIPYMGLEKDENPFLGYRAIRFCLDRKEDIYKPQLRALLRASAYGNIRIMVPLVTCIEEYRQALEFFKKNKGKLLWILIVTFFQRSTLFVLTYVIYRGFGLTGTDGLEVILLQASVYVAVDMLPIPGAQGITELMYSAVFLPVFTSAYLMPSMMVNRGVSFYLLMLISLAITIVRVVSYKRVKTKDCRMAA